MAAGDGAWLAQVADAGWIALHGGQSITIIKAHFLGEKPAYSYSGVVMPCEYDGWLEIHCEWSLPDIDISGIRYETGGRLVEYFSPSRRYNIFRVYDRAGAVTGLYGNVTAPITLVQDVSDHTVLTWTDQYLDVIKLPDGTVHLLDEDEYAAAGIPQSDPLLDAEIRAAATELLAEFESDRWDG